MLSIEEINILKEDSRRLSNLISNGTNGNLVRLLEKLGKLPSYFDKAPLLRLLKNESDKVRALALKNLAKLSDPSLVDEYLLVLKHDNSSSVRREAVSAIGRLRNKKCIPILSGLLKDYDPEVVLQAIRGLLIFKNEQQIQKELKKLSSHPNEIIREVINKEFNGEMINYQKTNHTESPDFLKNAVVHGDVRDILKLVPEDSIHLTFTSPPYYNARDYSIYQSYEEYLNFLEEVFKEVYRVTKEGRFFVLNTSPIIIPRVSRQHSSKRYPIPYDIHPLLIKMGWEFIDDILWVKPEACVKNRVGGFFQHRKPLAYKPNSCSESIMVYRKKTDRLIDWNIKQYSKEIIEKSKVRGNFDTNNLWEIDPAFDKTHSAIFPLELCNRIIKYYSFVGDLVFDPFAGSGTFGKSALNLGRYFFLTEKESKYIERIKENVGLNSRLNSSYRQIKFMDLKTFSSTIF